MVVELRRAYAAKLLNEKTTECATAVSAAENVEQALAVEKPTECADQLNMEEAIAAEMSTECPEEDARPANHDGALSIGEASAVETYTSATAVVIGAEELTSFLIHVYMYSGDDEEDRREKALKPPCFPGYDL